MILKRFSKSFKIFLPGADDQRVNIRYAGSCVFILLALSAIPNFAFGVATLPANAGYCILNAVSIALDKKHLVVSNSPSGIIQTNDTFICANSTLQLKASTALTYQWTPAAGLSDATIQNPVFTAGSTNAVNTYHLTSVALGNNLITNGDFEQGNTGFYTDYIYCNTGNCLFPLANNGYSVQSDPTFVHAFFTGSDHTTGAGQFMIVNGAIPTYIAWQQTIAVKPNTDYVFAAWICSMYPQSPALLNFTINGTPTSNNFVAPSTTKQWVQYYIKWNSGSSTSAVISLNDINPASSGNDFGLDDIFFGEPVSNTGSVTITTVAGVSSVNIAASANTICSGQNVTFTATATNGGPAPTYQWRVNSNNAGTNNATFSSTALSNDDVISCLMTANAPCVASPLVTSNSIAIKVNPQVTPSVNISASVNNICNGTPVIFTATPVNGGTSPTYQWLLNGNNIVTNNAVFSSSTLANGDLVSCLMNSNALCVVNASATSNTITMSVNTSLAPSVIISASASSVCSGSTVTFAATPENAGTSPSYQWLLNGNNAGTNSPAFSSNSLVNGDVVSCIMTSNAACTVNSASSNSITMILNTLLTPSINITTSANNICGGTPVIFTATPTNGGSTPKYQWLLNGSSTGANSSTYSSSTLANGDVISCSITSNAACLTTPTAVSNKITMNISSLVTPEVSISVSGNNFCAGNTISFTASTINGGSSPSYQWLHNGINAGTNSPTFSSTTLVTGDVISCIMTVSDGCTITPTATSNSIAVTISQQVAPSISISASENSFCAGSLVTFTATAINTGKAPFYQWLLNGNNTGINSPAYSSNSLTNSDNVSCMFTSNATCVVPASAVSNIITVNVHPLPIVSAGGLKTIKDGSNVLLNGTSSVTGADITWNPALGLSSNKILNPMASPSSTTLYTLTVVTADGCIGTDTATVKVLKEISIPTAFSPNSDGVNDLWDIKYLKDYGNSVIRVFDRYGQEVYSSHGYFKPWDGTKSGKRLPFGTYYYLINLNNGNRPLTGYVVIVR